MHAYIFILSLKPSANERKKRETRNTKQNGLYRVHHSETNKKINSQNVVLRIKQCLIRETCFHRNMCETKSNDYVSLYRQRCC